VPGWNVGGAVAIALIGIVAAPPAFSAALPLKVGAVSRHASGYVGKPVNIAGYVLASENGYVLISDEPGGSIGHYDLPVTGEGLADLKPRVRYVFEGQLLDRGLKAVNGDPVHLELTAPPSKAKR
jgi:hypothetical protein